MVRILMRLALGLAVLSVSTQAAGAAGVRIKDITDFEGARANQIYGLGLVTGLEGTGSRSLFTQQVAIDMLRKMEVGAKIFQDLPSDNVIRSTNISVVMVTAEIGPFSRKGSRLSVIVSSLDDTKSLQGGTLILTPLRGADNHVYAVAQGPVAIGGAFSTGRGANSVTKNHPTAGIITDGAIVEEEALGEFHCKGALRLLLRQPDFNTAQAIAKAINGRFPHLAAALDAGTVHVLIPHDQIANPVRFASEIGMLEVTPDTPARVVINERTGTIVAGEHVRISRVAISQGNLVIVKSEEQIVSQPPPFSGGQTTVTPQRTVTARENGTSFNEVGQTVTVGDLARALNALGVSPRDLMAIFQALERSGALHATLVTM
jgi:flagellar P-ring protein precursor FlgI